ncbi:hypothetical protein L6452_32960 [Arctium lappa]|uniref:Uncharacterized protein n=1 Tax=Arctium lappa TaxID=4217 RepID=A0ACB8ZAE5_ARCLA|nr:hypothetical protein L6452_32960 [Arctium lappa]
MVHALHYNRRFPSLLNCRRPKKTPVHRLHLSIVVLSPSLSPPGCFWNFDPLLFESSQLRVSIWFYSLGKVFPLSHYSNTSGSG